MSLFDSLITDHVRRKYHASDYDSTISEHNACSVGSTEKRIVENAFSLTTP